MYVLYVQTKCTLHTYNISNRRKTALKLLLFTFYFEHSFAEMFLAGCSQSGWVSMYNCVTFGIALIWTQPLPACLPDCLLLFCLHFASCVVWCLNFFFDCYLMCVYAWTCLRVWLFPLCICFLLLNIWWIDWSKSPNSIYRVIAFRFGIQTYLYVYLDLSPSLFSVLYFPTKYTIMIRNSTRNTIICSWCCCRWWSCCHSIDPLHVLI